MEKRFELSGKTAEGRPLIHLVEPGSGYGLGEMGELEKTASGEHLPEVLQLIEAISPQPGRLYLVNSALGAGEYVGFNLRGDWFSEKGLTHTPPGWNDIPVWDIDARRQAAAQTEHVPGWGDMAWGYPTFYNAHRFRHHANKDPNRAYGFILGAFWDPRMHRVILVSELIEDLCKKLGAIDLYERIRRGEFVDTSMGAKVPNDICSICGHVAKTPALYCEHVRKNAPSPYGMRSILPDGRMCGVYNTHPRFFDDSFVFIGAERSAKTMANVTGLVRGNRAYGNKVYSPPPRRMAKAASYNPSSNTPGTVGAPGAVPTNEREEQEQELGTALKRVANPPPPSRSESSSGEQISEVLSTIPVASEKERAALAHASEARKKQLAIRDGTLTQAELDLWTAKELQELKGKGVAPEQRDRMRTLLYQQMARAFGEKRAEAKWAEHLKRIPVASMHQARLSLDLAKKMPPLPLHALDYIKQDLNRRIRAAAALGVILTPEEFQYASLPQAKAEDCRRCGKVFAPMSVDLSHEPRFRMGAPARSDVSALSSRLEGMLSQRSFAPRLVVIRISRPSPSMAALPAPALVHGDEDLNKVAQLYNDYRSGLLAQAPDWRYVSAPAETSATLGELLKMGDAANSVSNLLLHLAYWPGLHLG
jgi:hypothetical protein